MGLISDRSSTCKINLPTISELFLNGGLNATRSLSVLLSLELLVFSCLSQLAGYEIFIPKIGFSYVKKLLELSLFLLCWDFAPLLLLTEIGMTYSKEQLKIRCLW